MFNLNNNVQVTFPLPCTNKITEYLSKFHKNEQLFQIAQVLGIYNSEENKNLFGVTSPVFTA